MAEKSKAGSLGKRRILRACDSCFAKKIKCDAVEPQCDYCRHHDLLCTYSRSHGISSCKPRKDDLSRNCSNVSVTTNDGNESPGSDLSLRTEAFSTELFLPGLGFGELATVHSGPTIFDASSKFIRFCTAKSVSLPKFSMTNLPWQTQSLQNDIHLSSQPTIYLPDRCVTEECMSDFYTSFQRRAFPVIDLELFKTTVDLAYSHSAIMARPEYVAARNCVYSFLCMVSMFEINDKVPPEINLGSCIKNVQAFIPRLIQRATIDGLQTLIFLCLFHMFSGDIKSAAMLNSMSCRVLFQFGAHILINQPPGSQIWGGSVNTYQARHLRDLFWLSYSFDKEISLRLGQPPSIDDEHCDLSLPPGYEEMQRSEVYHERRFPKEYSPPLYPWDIRLSFIKSRAYNTLYSPKGLRQKTKAELIRDIRELDDDLERWRMSLRPPLRPKLDVSHGPKAKSSPNMQSIMLNLAYYHCIALIHRASGRCYDRILPLNPKGHYDGLGLSLAISVTASRSSLNYLRSVLHLISGHCFWVVLFYPLSAILTIFHGIVLHPGDTKALDDIKSLTQVPELIKGIQICRLTRAEILQMSMVETFVKELVRLGTCAIDHGHGS